jgi:hypothetical protein
MWNRSMGAVISVSLMLGVGLTVSATAQQPAGGDARDAAPIDLEGYWVSVVTEDWRWRMVVPAKGDYSSVPLNDEGIRVTEMWDPAATEADSCLPYGAANVMRMPTRLRTRWTDADTLRIETDHGRQTREFHFDARPAPGAPSRQGHSQAMWDGSALKVRTTDLLPGYLRRNGVPYSGSAEVTEYYNTHSAYGRDGFTVTTIVHDPIYLADDFVTSTTFLRLDDRSEWNPTSCSEPE